MNTRELLKITSIAISLLLCLVFTATISDANQSDEFDSIYIDEIRMIKGELVTVKVYTMTRVSITNPEIADIADANSDELLIVGKAIGQTALFIWDEEGKRTVMVYVFNQDLNIVKNRIKNE